MDDTTRLVLIYVILPVVLGIGTFIMKSVFSRLDVLEKDIHNKVEEEKVRQLLADKIDPVREDIQELKNKLDRLMDFLIAPSR